jgi:hypothetical protein
MEGSALLMATFLLQWWWVRSWMRRPILLGLAVLLAGCDTSGDSGSLSPQATPSLQLAQQAVEQLLTLYREAFLQEDIDRLQALLLPQEALPQANVAVELRTPRQEAEEGFSDAQTFRDAMSATFRTVTITALQVEAMQFAADRSTVIFLEVESVENAAVLAQQTRVFRTTWHLAQDEADGIVTFRIAAVRREGPLFVVTTPGQVVAGIPMRVTADTPMETVLPSAITAEVPETESVQALTVAADGFLGTFTPPTQAAPEPLRVRIRRGDGTETVLRHRYRLRMPGEGVVQQIAQTSATRLRAVAIDPDGFIWAGGDQGATVYRVSPGATTALRVGQLFPENPAGRVEDMVVDQLGRVHFLTFAQGTADFPADNRVVVLVQGTFCPTVNIADPNQDYPFQVRDIETGTLQPSPST